MDREEAGRLAGEIARSRLLEIFERRKSLEAAAARVHQALNAKVVRVFNDNINGIIYSKPLVDHGIRLKAADLVLKVADVYPDERLKVSVGGELVEAIRQVNERHRKRTGDGTGEGS